MIMREATSGSRRVFLSELSKHNLQYEDLNVFLEIGSPEGIVQAGRAGYDIAFVSDYLTQEGKYLGKLTVVKVADWDLHCRVLLMKRILSSPQRVTDAFWSFVPNPCSTKVN